MHSRPDSNRMIMASYIGSYTPAIATFDVATTALDWAIFVTGFAGISMEVYYLNNTHYVFSTNAWTLAGSAMVANVYVMPENSINPVWE